MYYFILKVRYGDFQNITLLALIFYVVLQLLHYLAILAL